MLDQLRQGAQSWVSKLLMLLLVLSFAVWGIGGFQGYGAGTVATVGDTEVGVQEFARLYDRAQRNARQTGQPVDPNQVLSAVLMNAALDDAASDYGLGVSDDKVADEIARNEAFQNPDGSFDRERFAYLINNAGFNHDDFINDLKRDLVRGQVAETVNAGLQVPQPLVAALYRLQNEERTIAYFAVDASAIEAVTTPGEGELQTYLDENKGRFRAPEYRKLAVLTLDPQAIADPAAVTEEEVAADYERRKPSLTQAERRRIEQLRFPTAEAAEAAMKRIEGGEAFTDAAAASGVEITDLGVKAKAEVLDPAVAEAAFSAEANKPVLATEGALEPSIVMVTSIEPGKVTPLADMAERIRQDLALRAAREHVHELYDQVEDARAEGATLEEAASKLSLPYRVIDAVSLGLATPDGGAVSDIPAASDVVREAFDSDVGVENSPVRSGNDVFVFYEVLDIVPARDRALDEIRDELSKAWTEDETERRVSERADQLFERLKTGAPLATLAGEVGQTVQTAKNVKRNSPPAGLSMNAVAQAFAGPEGHVANAEGDGNARILLKVERVVAPAFFAEAADAKQISERISVALSNDLLSTYNRQLLNDRSTSINNAAYQQLTGQLQTQ